MIVSDVVGSIHLFFLPQLCEGNVEWSKGLGRPLFVESTVGIGFGPYVTASKSCCLSLPLLFSRREDYDDDPWDDGEGRDYGC